MVNQIKKRKVPKEKILPSSIVDVPFVNLMGEKYLAYALSTITSRSLPDVRDGLKPVHRRLLYAMRQLKLDPKSGFKKCARVVGDVIGKYHPHGDQAVYDALVRLAQNFAVRYPLVDGQGNFGNIDGDNAAAMRYTEARLTEVAEAMMLSIDEDAVDFRETYDSTEREPVVMPAAFPNLLANGSSGIAVGMATNIPPHNIKELCEGLLHLIKYPNARLRKILDLIPGPDFPTGGELTESNDVILSAYSSGKGSMRIRAKWETEDIGRGLWQIIISELPYQVQKSKLIERIADLIFQKKIQFIENIHDDSAEDVRIIIIPKSRSLDPKIVMENLFQNTDLEVKFNLNMNVIDEDGKPNLLNIREVLQSFLNHRHDVLIRCSNYNLKKMQLRIEILSGFLLVYLNLDKLISIIRKNDEPKNLIMKAFKISEIQVDAILNMRIRSLRKLEELEIKKEYETLVRKVKSLKSMLKNSDKQWAIISQEIIDIRDKFSKNNSLGIRRTLIKSAPKKIIIEDIEELDSEPITVICSKKGWIRSIKGHIPSTGNEKYKEGDSPHFWIYAKSNDKLILFASNGRFYNILCSRIPSGRGFGEPLRLFVDLPNDMNLISLFVYSSKRKILLASSDGRGLIIPEIQTLAQTRTGKQILNLKNGHSARVCTPVEGDHTAIIGENRKLLIIKQDQIPEMLKGRGVTLQRYKEGSLSDAICFDYSKGLSWHSGSRVFTHTDLELWLGKRGGAGRIAPKGFARNNRFTL